MCALKKKILIGIVLACLFSCGCTDREMNNSWTTVSTIDPSSPPLTTASSIPEPQGIQTQSFTNNVSELYALTHREDIRRMQSNESDYLAIYYVPLETARLHGNVELARIFYTHTFGMATPDYQGVRINPDPKIVYDGDTGKRIYYVYCAVNPYNQCLASTAVPAIKILGNPGPGGAIGSGTSDEEMIHKAQEYFDEQHPFANLTSARFVSTCWGELLRVRFHDMNTTTEEQIDLLYGSPKPIKRCTKSTDITSMSKQEMDQRSVEWKESDRYYQSIVTKSAISGVNISEPFTYANEKIMGSIFSSE